MPGSECSKVRKAMDTGLKSRRGRALEKQKMGQRGGSLRGEEETQETSSSREFLLQGISKWLFRDVRIPYNSSYNYKIYDF